MVRTVSIFLLSMVSGIVHLQNYTFSREWEKMDNKQDHGIKSCFVVLFVLKYPVPFFHFIMEREQG